MRMPEGSRDFHPGGVRQVSRETPSGRRLNAGSLLCIPMFPAMPMPPPIGAPAAAALEGSPDGGFGDS
ncbi:MAG TPA: hypothetical protein VK465_01340, partial [Fibrobacteria bacterium]|nr:hypothetical protein [Fibrobacteria bacterium]